MDQLLALPIEDPPTVQAARAEGGVQLGLALAEAGLSVEAAQLLRPLRKTWSKGARAATGKAALDAVAWWNKTWRDVARAMHADDFDRAEALLGDRAATLWDQPALVAHLARRARVQGKGDLARHLFAHLKYLADRGVPKIDMTAFRYVAAAGLIDALSDEGDIDAALVEHAALTPNAGNVMAHQIQGVRLLARADRADDAMDALADLLVTAEARKSGWSGEIRRSFAKEAPELAALRARPDWNSLIEAPAAYKKSRR